MNEQIVDEIQQLSQENVVYLFSRLRSTTVDYKKQIVATGNPSYESFIRHWVEFALDEHGVPVRKDNYPMRYFVQVSGGQIEWADTREELEELHGKGDENGILSFQYIPGNIYDNPPLMKADPTYVSKLKALPFVEQQRLLYGSWYARESASGYWKKHWVKEVLYPPTDVKARCRTWDLAFTVPNESSSKNPDFSVGALMSKNKDGIYTIEDIVRFRDRAHVVEETIISTAMADGYKVQIGLPLDPAGGGAYARGLQKRLVEMGFNCRLVKPTRGKVQRFAPFAAVAEGGFVQVVVAPWNEDLHNELESFDGSNKFKDDQADALSDNFILLNKEQFVPAFNLPDLSVQSNYNFSSGITLPSSGLTLP